MNEIKQRVFTNEFKQKAVRLMERGDSNGRTKNAGSARAVLSAWVFAGLKIVKNRKKVFRQIFDAKYEVQA